MKFQEIISLTLLCATLSSQSIAQAAPSAQAAAASIAATLHRPVPATGAPHADTAALAEISEYETLTLLSSNPAITLTGTTLIGDSQQGVTYQSSMIFGSNQQFRFDVHSSQQQSIRTSGSLVQKQGLDGRVVTLPETMFGAFTLSPAALKSLAANPKVSIVDDGFTAVDGKKMHKLTLSRPARVPKAAPLCADLYFDEGTHLLTYSVMSFMSAPTQRFPINQVVQYDMYSLESGTEMPHRLILSGDGGIGMTFTVSQVSTAAFIDESQFHF